MRGEGGRGARTGGRGGGGKVGEWGREKAGGGGGGWGELAVSPMHKYAENNIPGSYGMRLSKLKNLFVTHVTGKCACNCGYN